MGSITVAEEKAKTNRRPAKKAETVREKAEKATRNSNQPRRLQGTRRRAAKPFRVVGKALRRIGRLKVFRIIGYILVPPYFRNSWKELRQVTWPSRRESLRLTSAVFAFALIFGLLVAITDYGLDKVFKQVLLK
jgi:preprotein translocase SecE subunit